MMTGSLLDVDALFQRLDPARVAALLAPGLGQVRAPTLAC